MLDEKRINPYRMFQGGFVPNWLLRRREVSGGAKLTYARLMQYAGKNGEAYPFMRTLAQEIGVSTRQARYNIAELIEFGLIEVESHKEEGKANRYWFLNHPWIWDASEQDADEGEEGEGGVTDTTGGEDHQQDSSHPTGSMVPTLQQNSSHPTGTILPLSKRVIEATQETSQVEGAAGASLTADATPDPHPAADPAGPTAVKIPPETVGAGGESSDASSVHVDAPREVWSRKALREKELARLRSANLLRDRQVGEQGMRQSRAKEEKLKNLKGRDGKLSKKVLGALEGLWLKGFATLFPGVKVIPWGPAERAQIEKLVLGHDLKGDKGYGEEVVRDSLKYVLVEWQGLKTRYLKGNGLAPSISFLFHHHATLCVEAQRWVGLFKIEREYEVWRQEHPAEFNSPPDLMQRYLTAKDELDELRGVKKAVAR